MEIAYFFYKTFDAIDKNFYETAHASVAKELNIKFSSRWYSWKVLQYISNICGIKVKFQMAFE